MEAAGLTVEDKAEKVEIDDTAESTIFSGMSAEEAQEHMTVGTGVKKAAEAENEKTEEMRMQTLPRKPSEKPKKRMKRRRGKRGEERWREN